MCKSLISYKTPLKCTASLRSIVLDYDIEISPLDEEDKVFVGGSLGNYRLV